MYLREYDFECAVSMAKDGKERGDREHLARALTMLQDYRHALGQLKPGDRMEFGSYFVANDIKPIKLLLRVPIVWLVLENDRTDGSLLLLSERSLDWEFYGDMGACSWEASYLRKWLNGACLDDWFAQEERILMSRTVCRPEKNQISDVSDEETTEDWLFLLSFSEVLQYFGGKGPGKAWKNVRRFLFERYTDHYPVSHRDAVGVIPFVQPSYQDKRAMEISYEAKEWWLRTPGVDKEYRMVVCADGSVDVQGMKVGCDEVGVRPALRLRPDALEQIKSAFVR